MTLRIRHLAVLVLAVLAVVGSMWSPAGATPEGEERIRVRVQDIPVDPADDKEPVPGVTVVVTDPAGTEVASGVTDDEGVADIFVPSAGSYVVTLDTETLPEGFALTSGDAGERTVTVTQGLGANAAFNLGEATGGGGSKIDRLPQTLLNGIRFGLVIAIMSVGLSLIYGTTGLSNFAHAETVTLGAVVAFTIDTNFRPFDATTGGGAVLQLGFATLIGIAATMAFSGFLETGVFKPMRKRRIGLTSMMIVSIGIAIFIRFLIQFRFGGQPKAYPEFSSQRNLEFGPFGITPRDLVAGLLSLTVLGAVAWMLIRTRIGKAIRAVSDNPELSSSTGINTDGIILFVWLLGGALAGLGGVLFGLDELVQWNMGTRLLLLMFAAITLGGLGRPFGALVGSLVVGVTVQLWAWAFGSFTDLKNVGALAALILILLVRPQGILGRRERIG